MSDGSSETPNDIDWIQTLSQIRSSFQNLKVLYFWGSLGKESASETDEVIENVPGRMYMWQHVNTGPDEQVESFGELLKRWFLGDCGPDESVVRKCAEIFTDVEDETETDE